MFWERECLSKPSSFEGPQVRGGMGGPPHPVASGLWAPCLSHSQPGAQATRGADDGVRTAQSSAHTCVSVPGWLGRQVPRLCVAGEPEEALEGAFQLP